MVKNIQLILVGLLCWTCTSSPTKTTPAPSEIKTPDQLNLIPQPLEIASTNGHFALNSAVDFTATPQLQSELNYLIKWLQPSCTFNIHTDSSDSKDSPFVKLELVDQLPEPLTQQEAYTLAITDQSILLQGTHSSGIFRGIQTLRQLFIPAFFFRGKRDTWYLPTLTIKDEPQFEHRGLLLDVCRHFFDKAVVLKHLDALAFYKMNVLHFHLTEDQGWRMPIDKFPLLNTISAWRMDSTGTPYGGYYTKDELHEIVAYAQERHITVIPEIELPGHAQAALAAYPQFSCAGGPIEVANDWGVFKEIYCAGNDSTFLFLESVLTEVMEIFPSKYIHIGGDEAPKFRWEHCKKCQQRMREENLKDEHELQAYFIRRIEQFLNENGRQLIGWDEILEGGLSENATVQSWRGTSGGVQAAEEGHNVIMSPTSHCYLDYGLKAIDLKKIYSFSPIPAELDSAYHAYVLGGEGNMWTERVPDEATLDQRVFPRIIGLAEALWSAPEKLDFDDFYARLQPHYPILSEWGIAYGPETIGAFLSTDFSKPSTIRIEIGQNLPDLEVHYRWAGEGDFMHTYTTPLSLEKSDTLIVQAFKNKVTYGSPVKQTYACHKALNTTVDYATAYNQWYVGNGKHHLVDGSLGSIDFRDGNWQGFWGENIDVTLDLGSIQPVHEIATQFYQYANSWIFLPKAVHISTSENGENWVKQFTEINTTIDLTNQKSVKPIIFKADKAPLHCRYIRLEAINIGKVPAEHEAAGSDAWLFIDEIIVN